MRVFSLAPDTAQQEEQMATRTYKTYETKIEGFVDGLEAIKQAVYKRLSTEQYEYPVYSFDYGVNWKKLIGKEQGYIRPELQRMVTEALAKDDRVKAVSSFKFSFLGDSCECTFLVETGIGDIEMGVTVNV